MTTTTAKPTKQSVYAEITANPALAYQTHAGENIERELARIPNGLRVGLIGYVLIGLRPGSFLCAALDNNFVKAVTSADFETARHLRDIAIFIVNVMPDRCHGNRMAVNNWIKAGGLMGDLE